MKKVTFNENKNKVKVMVTWRLAAKLARKKFWEFFAIDRIRFKTRVEKIGVVIEPILDYNHRKKIYGERFQ